MFFPVLFGGGAIEATAVLWSNTIPGYLYAFQISDSGFGSQYSGPLGAGPANDTRAMRFTRTDDAIVWGGPSSEQGACTWSNSTGFGTNLSDPATPAVGNITDTAFTAQNNYVALTSLSDSPYLWVYPWSVGFGTKLSNPGTLPLNGIYRANFSYDGAYLAVGWHRDDNGDAPYMAAYNFDQSGGGSIGSQVSAPLTPPTNSIFSLNFSPDGAAVVVVQNTGVNQSPIAYHWSSAGWGAKFANPGVFPADAQRDVKFNVNSTVIGFPTGGGNPGAPAAWAFDTTSGWGSKYSQPTNIFNNNVWFCDFASQNSLFVVGGNAGAGPTVRSVNMWPWDDSTGFGSRFSDMSPGVDGAAYEVTFNGRFKGTS